MNVNLQEITTSPGVYIFIDSKGRAIYVGKAKNLRARLASYFNSGVKTIKTEKMLSHAKSFKTIVTENEVEAFLLEANLIKTEMPKYNILLKDSKSYPYVKLTNEAYPRLIYTRQLDDENATYFGPFVNVGELKHIIELLQNSFPLRTCTNAKLNEGKICLKYQIKKCPAPCEKLISKEDYDAVVQEMKKFFKGDIDFIKSQFMEQMQEFSKKLEFEKAANIRDRLNALNKLFSKQTVVNMNDTRSVDFFYRHTIDSVSGVTQMFIRNGKVIGITTKFFSNDEDELLERFVMQFYANVRQFPESIALVGESYDDNLELALSKMSGSRVNIRKRGLSSLTELAKHNAEHQTSEYLKKVGERVDVSERLSELVGLDNIRRVECVDISHLGGDNTVGVSVVTINGEFSKRDYKKYKIRTAENDDFKAIYELFLRKGDNFQDKSEEEADLYIIDGGIGQLNAALKAAMDKDISAKFISISKSRSLSHLKHEGEESIEQIHLPNRKNYVSFRKNDPLLHFIQKIRDEAHRFAITYSRSISIKKMKYSPLLEIESMGVKRLKSLLTAFPDIHTRKDIALDDLITKAKLPKEVAESVLRYLADHL